MTLTPPSAPCCCDTDPIEGLKQLFVDYAQGRTILAGRDPATRPVFLRLHGVAHGYFVIEPNLPDDLRIGVFGRPTTYPTWVRFSSDVQPGRPDLKGTLGIGIKLFGVEGPKLIEPHDAATHDFILQNHDVFFTDTAHDMCAFTCESLNGRRDAYLDAHPVTKEILSCMEKVVESALATPYWSGLPFALGKHFVKYKLEPIQVPPGHTPDYDDPTYLRADLHTRLARGEARFRFSVQLQTQPETMPLDAATVRWCETTSPPIPVATLILPQQDLGTRGQDTYGENLSYNTWRALDVHRPIGSIADARQVVYQASAANRRNVNGVPLGEPTTPRPPQFAPGTDYPPAKARVVRASIHPAIGIARVGNSNEFFVGPQVTAPPPRPAGFYRDAHGALKREACEFRIYGYNADDEVVSELTAETANISWSVHVANRKAEWFQWKIALDIPEAKDETLVRRNRDFGTQDFALPTSHIRSALVVDPGVKSISGRAAKPVPCAGHFMGVDVSLGELRTDQEGRLLFLGGHGVSASPTGSPILPIGDKNAFINADGWYDDICDGFVEAHVTIEGRSIPVETAWVVTAPPNYAPQIKGQRTLYDLLYDLYVQAGWLPTPGRPSFTHDVYPILARLSDLQWVNQGFATLFGHGGRFNFKDPAFIERLAQRPASGFDPHTELRRQIFNSFRPPNPADGNQMPWPWLYGDAMDVPAAQTPRQNASITVTQHTVLARWAKGDFTADWQDHSAPPASIEEVSLADQPATLDRAALDHALADAFHPGCEVTWPIRHLTMYRSPFRIRRRAPDDLPTEGAKLTSKQALAPNGPLYGQRPGDVTRWMGLPWQADTAFCRAGYDASYDPFAPTFWPARVPNQVLSEADYQLVIDPSVPMARRIEAFVERTNWNEPLYGSTDGFQMEQMVRIFGSMGLVEVQPGVPDSPDFPDTMMVASFGPDVPLKMTVPSAADSRGDTRLLAENGSAAEPEATRALPRGANFRHPDEALNAPLPVTRSHR